jgi:phospholipid/cholesterol/gamma-HCH transport system permease protein
VAFVRNCGELCRARNVEFRDDGLPEGVRRLLRLAEAVPEKEDAHHAMVKSRLLQRMGEHALKGWASALEMFTFLGENIAALGNLLRGRAQFRWSDAFLLMQECGSQALGTVAMINFLVGLILAFVGAVQLMKFGATSQRWANFHCAFRAS